MPEPQKILKPLNGEYNQAQALFFHNIKNSLSAARSLVDEVADLLNISNDSAYRRIRGEKELDFTELQTLSSHYKISVDQALSLQSDQVLFRAPEINLEPSSFLEYLKAMLGFMQYFNSFATKKMLYFCKDITFFHFYLFPEIAAFKTFFWSKTIRNLEAFKGKIFSLEEYTMPDCFQLGQSIIKEYNKIPSVELWNHESIHSTISQLKYYKEGGYFKKKEDFLAVIESLQKCLDHIETEVEKGVKFMPGDSDLLYKSPLQFHINEVIIGNNTILVELNEEKLTFVTYNVLSYLITKDTRFNKKAFDNFHSLLGRSTQVSLTGERDRRRFFNTMREKLETLKAI